MAEQIEKIIIYTDGGSRGNPGPAAASFILTDTSGNQLQARAFFLGRATNNTAEYTGLTKALRSAKQIGAKEVTVTGVGGNCVDLVIRIEAHYMDFTAPTN